MMIYTHQALAQQTPIEMAYEFVKSDIRAQFEKSLAMLEQKKGNASPQLYKDALGGIKSSHYYKAVVFAGCVAEFCMTTRKGKNGENTVEYSDSCSDDKVNACTQPKLLAFVQYVKSVDQYIALDRKQQTGCMLKARLFDLEMKLRPYDFLVQEEGNELHDFKALNECYLSKFK